MIRRPPRSTLDRSSAASDVYKRQVLHSRMIPISLIIALGTCGYDNEELLFISFISLFSAFFLFGYLPIFRKTGKSTQSYSSLGLLGICLLYTSDAADERSSVDLGGRRIIKKKNNIKHVAGAFNIKNTLIHDTTKLKSLEKT